MSTTLWRAATATRSLFAVRWSPHEEQPAELPMNMNEKLHFDDYDLGHWMVNGRSKRSEVNYLKISTEKLSKNPKALLKISDRCYRKVERNGKSGSSFLLQHHHHCGCLSAWWRRNIFDHHRIKASIRIPFNHKSQKRSNWGSVWFFSSWLYGWKETDVGSGLGVLQ